MGITSTLCFISTLALGTILTLSSHHWLLAWMGLELNTLAIIPLLASNHHPRAVESATKYFLTQAAAAALILFSSINNAWISGEWDIINLSNPMSTILMTIALSIKLGLAPFHFWLPEVLQGTSLTWGLVLTTWQKLAPMALMYSIAPNLNLPLLMSISIISILVGGWGGLNQTQIRKILAYSSISHMGWMAIIMPFSPNLALLNLMIYIFMTSSMFLSFNFLSTTTLSSLSSSWSKTPILISLISLTLLSMGGLPPLSGFLPKLMILLNLTHQKLLIISFLISLLALLSLFFYVRLLFTLSLTVYPNTPTSSSWWRKTSTTKTFITSTLLIMSSFTMLTLPSLFNLF